MHHAYLYTGALSVLHSLAKDAEAQFQFAGEHNPDVQVHEFEKFGIDEARGLKTAASMRSLSGRALYIVGVSQITTEAQQALLKLFEEPQQGAIFVLLAPHGAIIPTLRSRMLAYPFTPQQNVSQKVLGSASPQPDHFGQEISPASRLRILVEHTKLFEELLGDVKNFAIMKKHFKSYVEGFDGAKDLRVQLMETTNAAEVTRILEAFTNS